MKHLRGTTARARDISQNWLLSNFSLAQEISIGLPEYDDRFDMWRVPLHAKYNGQELIGEIKLDRDAKEIKDWTEPKLIGNRLKKNNYKKYRLKEKSKNVFCPTPIPNQVILGNSIEVLKDFPKDTAQLIFTSPPYFNAKPEYSEYVTYEEYLNFIEKVFKFCYSVLSEGRFMVVNISPVLIRRTSRSTSRVHQTAEKQEVKLIQVRNSDPLLDLYRHLNPMSNFDLIEPSSDPQILRKIVDELSDEIFILK